MPLDIILTPVEARVLGSLVEKELTTPESYPLSINGLTLACNQKSNRDPIMFVSEEDAMRAIDALRPKQLAWQRSMAGARVMKYAHNLGGRWTFGPDEIAVMCVLLLRGPQTVGEIKGRTGRMHDFPSLPEVELTLQKLMTREDGPFVVKLPRLSGRKESRFAHLLCGTVEVPAEPELPVAEVPVAETAGADRIAALETQVRDMGKDIEDLKAQFAGFKKQHEEQSPGVAQGAEKN